MLAFQSLFFYMSFFKYGKIEKWLEPEGTGQES